MHKAELYQSLKEKKLEIERIDIIEDVKINELPLMVYKTIGTEAIFDWHKFRELREKTGLHPIIVKSWKDYLYRNSSNEIEKSIERALLLNPKKILAEALELNLSFTNQTLESFEDDWPVNDTPLNDSLITLQGTIAPQLRKIPHKELEIVLIQVQEPWSFLAFFDIVPLESFYFYHNEEEHIAIMKYFYDNYKVEPMAIAFGENQFFVGNPPKLREEALSIAIEHFSYCYDAIRNAGGSLQALASKIINAQFWYFGWLELILD